MQSASARTENGRGDDAGFRDARSRLLEALAPGTRIEPFTWSAGTSEALVLGDGPPLVLVHGGFSSNVEWVPVLRALARHHRVIAPDRPGCGVASSFDYRGVDVEAHASRWLEETLDAFGVDAAPLVGNSMGGRWAIAFAARHPARVQRLILPGAPAGSEGRRLPFPVHAMRLPGVRRIVKRKAGHGSVADTRAFAGSFLVAQPDRMPDAFWDAMGANLRLNMPGWLPFAANVVQLRGRVGPGLALDGRLRDVTVPVHFIWGERDAFASVARGRVVARDAPRCASFHVVPGAGHLPWLDAPEPVVRAILAAAAPAE